MTEIIDWLKTNDVLAWWLFVASLVMFVGSLLAVPWAVVRIPADYFAERRRGHRRWETLAWPLRWLLIGVKNLLGLGVFAAGVVMLFVPGQGILTMAVGILLLDFPGKFRVERWIVTRGPVRRSIDYLRRRAGRDPLIIDHEPNV